MNKFLSAYCFAKYLFGVTLLCINPFLGIAAAGELTFTPGGEIVSPSGKISVGYSGGINITTATDDNYSLTIPTIIKGGKTHWNAGDLEDKNVVVDTANKETTFTANIVDAALTAPIPVRFGISLSPEGKARITLSYSSKEPIQNLLSLSSVFFYIQRSDIVGAKVSVNNIVKIIEEAPPTTQTVNLTAEKSPQNIVFASDDPYRSVNVHVVKAQNVLVRDENLKDWQTVGTRFNPVDNQIIFDVDLPPKAYSKSAETYAGVDFYAAEKIHLPQYNLSRNLIQNPSFEQGFQYWNFGNLGSDKGNRFADNYEIETGHCHSGNKCLKILGEKGEAPALLATFAIPVEAGKEYTLSFYAKGDRPNLQLMTSLFPSSFSRGLAWKDFKITQEWQRYNYTFKAPSGALTMQFGISTPAEDCIGFLDDIQLEQGALTDFTRKQIELAFVTNHRNNLFKPDEAIKGRWEISGPPETKGSLTTILRNIEGATIATHQASFRIGSNGSTLVNQPWLEHQSRGLYTLEANLKTNCRHCEERSDVAIQTPLTNNALPLKPLDRHATHAMTATTREYARLTIAPPAEPTVKHHTLFAIGGVQTRQGSWERKLAQLEYFGIGSAMNFDPIPHAHLALMQKHHITNVTSIFDSGDHFGKISLVAGWSGNEAELPIIEEAAYAKAKAYPEIIYWKLVNEPRGTFFTDEKAMKQWIVALTAAYRGIKRANPQAKVLSIDPANMSPTFGIAMLDKYLAAGGGAITDIIAIHPYRARPEAPDMDTDTVTLIAMLKRHNYQGEIWFTEGGGHLGMHNPYFALDVHKSLSAEDNGGSWRIGNFTYDIGKGERYAAAYAVRAWLVGLKYGDQVKQQVDWYFGSGAIDYDGTAEVRAVALNTLISVLGDANFVQDIPLNLNTRCYLFKDAQNRPVAVIWNINPKQNSQVTLHLGERAAKLEIVNMLGTTIAVDKKNTISISNYPIYLRGEVGDTENLMSDITYQFKSSNQHKRD